MVQGMLRGILLFIVLPLIATPIVVLIGFSLFQEKLLFHPEPLKQGHLFRFDQIFQEIRVPVDHVEIHSLYFPVENSKSLILYFHGNAGNLDSWGVVAGDLAQNLKANVWIMDYPGFGLSQGRVKSESQFTVVAESFADRISERGAFDQVIIYGRSIGTGPAAQLAKNWNQKPGRPPLTAMILETPFNSLVELIHNYASWFPEFLMKYRFYNSEALQEFKGPILILHGRKDEIIPVEQGEALAETLAIRGSVTFVEIPNGMHNNLREYPEYQVGLSQWWQELQARR